MRPLIVPVQHSRSLALAIQKALSETNPWQALKALATRPGSSFQFVLKTELQTFIDNKANSKHGAAVPSQKKKDKKTTRSSTSTPLELDPSTLQLDAAHFVDDDGDCVPFISWRGFVMICYNLCYNLCYLIYVIYIHIHIHIIM